MHIRSEPHDGQVCVSVLGMAETSKVDGPGKRLVIFFQGCGIGCEWCHSPHLQTQKCPLIYNESLCLLCLRCGQVCERGVHNLADGAHSVRRELCTQCGKCIESCPKSSAERSGSVLYLPGVRLSVRSLFEQTKPYIELCDGITLSGGEALLQTEAAIALLKLCKNDGMNTALETSGLLNIHLYEQALPYVDTWLMGIRLKTGVNMPLQTDKIEAALSVLTSCRKTHIIPRIPLIPGITESIIYDTVKTLEKYGLMEIWLNPWNTSYDVYYKSAGFPIAFEPPSQTEIDSCEETARWFFIKSGFKIINNF